MRTAVMAVGVVLLAVACSSGGGDSPTKPTSPTDGSTGPSSTPTVTAGEIQPPPYPTCPPDIDCVPILRTVTIYLWSCDGGPCDGDADSGCQRSVSLRVGRQSFAPDPFFCLVQFHAVPAGDYLVTVIRRVACGQACDALELCQVVASANQIAIEPVADGECPVRVVS